MLIPAEKKRPPIYSYDGLPQNKKLLIRIGSYQADNFISLGREQ